jgi:hypothetical protein
MENENQNTTYSCSSNINKTNHLNIYYFPEDLKIIISGYYGILISNILKMDIIDYSRNLPNIIDETNFESNLYKLIFWKNIQKINSQIINSQIINPHSTLNIQKNPLVFHNIQISNRQKKTQKLRVIWGILNIEQRTNFIRYII